MAWGTQQWGQTQWGYQPAVADLELSSAVATNDYTIRVQYSEAVKQVDQTQADDALNANNYTISGGFRTLRVQQVTAVTTAILDLTVMEMTDGAAYTVAAADTVENSGGTKTVDPTANEAAFTGIGTRPRVVTVENPSPGVLEIFFSKTMLNSEAISRKTSYTVTATGEGKPVFIKSVSFDKDKTVTVLFTGGGSVYTLTALGLQDPAGNYLDSSFASYVFDLVNPGVDELFAGDNYQFETNLGAVTLSVNTLSQRNIEDLVLQRARNAGHNEQFRLISEALEDAGINRDETRLKLFKG